ncbi:hypothetical protein [Thalassobacillus devorans]|uniref:hypothetical protein n=1 Tax=Thalassobacillus devorans TaxID=279813 RepID=UPI000A1C7EC5|nr:hypothetical protein [Thalassobacillus devorans]
MRSLQDAVYNWLTIKVVAENRPDDLSANETADFFYEMLKEDHHLTDIEIHRDEEMYQVECITEDKVRKFRFPTELIELILNQIEEEPHKFKNYH